MEHISLQGSFPTWLANYKPSANSWYPLSNLHLIFKHERGIGTLVRKERRKPCSTGFQVIHQQNTLVILFLLANCEFLVWSVSFQKFEVFTFRIMSFMKITRLPNADCQACQVTSTLVARGVLLPVLLVSRSTMWKLWFFSCPQLTCCILLRKGEAVQYTRGGIFCLSLL